MIASSELKKRLADRAESLVAELLPNGKKSGKNWLVGSTEGEKGQSTSVCISGGKVGTWSDFALGEGGDLLDLVQAVLGLRDHGEARQWAINWLGIDNPMPSTPKRDFEKPARPKNLVSIEHASAAKNYLVQERKLTPDTLEAYRVAATADGIVFPFMVGDEPEMIKTLKVERVNGKKDIRPTSGNQKPVLFGWQAIPRGARAVTICEGEIDAMTLYQYGFPALSVPFGGGDGAKHQWLENEFERLMQFDVIWLCFDSDDAGKKAVHCLVDRLGRHRCKVVALPYKDANECLKRDVSQADIADAFCSAKLLSPSELRGAEQYAEDVIALLNENPADQGLTLPFPSLSNFTFRRGELTLIHGTNGHGKSWWTNQIGLEAVRDGAKVCAASMEFRPDRFMKRLYTQAAGLNGLPTADYVRHIAQWMAGRFWVYGGAGTAKVDRMLECFEYAYRAYGCDFFIIDPLAKCGIGLEDYPAQKEFIERLCDFKNEHDVHVVVVHHPRKLQNESQIPDKMDVGGAGALTDLADNVLNVWRNKRKEKAMTMNAAGEPENHDLYESEKDKPDTLISVQKQRNGEWEGRGGLWYRKECNQFVGGPKAKPFQYAGKGNQLHAVS